MRTAALGAIWLCFAAGLLAGCNYRREKGGGEVRPGTGWFARIRANVLEMKCLHCHTGMNAAKSIDLSSYEKVMKSGTVVPFKPAQSSLLTSITGGRMPKDKPGSVSGEEIQLLTKWIEAGAPETNQAVAPPPPEKPKASYRWLDENLFKPRCATCHRPPEPKGGVDFSTYTALLNSYGKIFKAVDEGSAETSGIYDQAKNKEMPPEQLEKLNDEELKAVGDWINAGAKEN